MASPSKISKNEFISLLEKAVKGSYPEFKLNKKKLEFSITTPKEDMGDLSSSIAFIMAKELKTNPREVAEKLVTQIESDFTLTSSKYVKSVGEMNGYINVFIKENEYTSLVLKEVASDKEEYGSSNIGNEKKVIVEFPSVNPNKPWLVSHLRNALLGDTIANLMHFCSYNVEREDYIDDLGIQIAESMWGYQNISNQPDKKFDQWIGEEYVEVNKQINEPGVKDSIKQILKQMEEKDSEVAKEARRISERVVMAQYETAANYRILHDVMIWESDILHANLLDRALEIAKEKGIARKEREGKYANCVIVDLGILKSFAKDFENPNEEAKVLVRSDGTATYVAKDFAFHMWKFGVLNPHFKFQEFISKQENGKPVYTTTSSEGTEMQFGGVDKAMNIIGSAQRYQQLILKAMLELVVRKGISESVYHLSYGEVRIEGGNLSGRKGGWIGNERNYTADSLLSKMRDKARTMISSRKEAIISDKDEVALHVALAAIKFEFLRIAPEKAVVFSWDRALDFESNSGPYCMYTYARAARILEKGQFKKNSTYSLDNFGRENGFELIKMIGIAQEIIEKACEEHRPNVITDYLIDLSMCFSRFYENVPVLNSGEEKDLRLTIVFAAMQTIGNMLLLLGIKPIAAM